MNELEPIEVILEERGRSYGDFPLHAQLTQNLKNAFYSHFDVYNPTAQLTFTQREAVDMIFHKLGRIGNGNPNFLDSWVDIVGYAQLVVNNMRTLEHRKIQEEVSAINSAKTQGLGNSRSHED